MSTAGAGRRHRGAGQASNGGEALRLLAQRPWDLLVLDMSMPGRDGVDLIRQIRRDHPAVPILVLTMHGEQQYAVQAIIPAPPAT